VLLSRQQVSVCTCTASSSGWPCQSLVSASWVAWSSAGQISGAAPCSSSINTGKRRADAGTTALLLGTLCKARVQYSCENSLTCRAASSSFRYNCTDNLGKMATQRRSAIIDTVCSGLAARLLVTTSSHSMVCTIGKPCGRVSLSVLGTTATMHAQLVPFECLGLLSSPPYPQSVDRAEDHCVQITAAWT
jgi:hypothetical protein